MGKLAQRYSDAARSGIYRVRDAAIPRSAAAEAGAHVLEFSATTLADGAWNRLRTALSASAGNAVVVLVDGMQRLAAERGVEYRLLVELLRAAALEAQCSGKPFFAVLLDQHGALPFPDLYKEKL